MSRLLIASAALVVAGMIAEAGVAPPVPRLPSAALERLKAGEPRVEIRSPEEIAERIQQNTKAAADRLAASDPGAETRKKQGQALKDLDELLKQAQDPMSGQGGGQSQQKDDKSPQGEQKSQSGGQSKSGGSGQQSKKQGWRNRKGQGQGGAAQKQQASGNPQQAKGQQPMGKEPTPTGKGQPQPLGPGDLKNAGGNPGGGARKGVPALPLDETITKQVWGHLPERLRQQMSQYYKEQFMPKYSDMLRRYYASLAEREKAQKK
ncbi:MAG TPA: hypothetical protein VFG68_19750 [Fimbriiglobus sp.]|nr:hypothetical protein [Fimbriiglobus sp.]